jgi:hypothetical protein
MSSLNPIPAGPDVVSQWQSTKPGSPPALPSSWTTTFMLSPFGDFISPLANYSQIVVGALENYCTPDDGWCRARLYLTKDQRYFDFIFLNAPPGSQPPQSQWYWIDSTPDGKVNKIYGPFNTTLRAVTPTFFSDNHAQWGNTYPLMCSNTNPKGIPCNHWTIPAPGSSDHGSWYALRRDTGALLRLFMIDATNPFMIPILGSFFIANLPTFTPDRVSDATKDLVHKLRTGTAATKIDYWNPMVTQEDIHRAMAAPLASASCTSADIDAVIPGFKAYPAGVPLPVESDKTYIEGWTLGTDFMPYYTRVCYLWTGDAKSKQQTNFIGLGTVAGQGTYLQRTDTCLNTKQTDQPYYEWETASKSWVPKKCLPPIPGVGLPYPDWVARSKGVVVAQVTGNPNFGLGPKEVLHFIAAELLRDASTLAIFWVWFLGDNTGMLFSEGNFVNPISHSLQLIDYTLFQRDANVTQDDFTNPCAVDGKALPGSPVAVPGHLTRISKL